MTRAEIVDTIGDFANAAWMAMEVGADALQIHGANG
jgi:2,4-dienoyl-CoA reductase-like NADH-dependent reductase (Old Yellow Enzyme family)